MFEAELKALGKSPWIKVTHEDVEYMVRIGKDHAWVSRMRDRAVWLYEAGEIPDWVFTGNPMPAELEPKDQGDLFA